MHYLDNVGIRKDKIVCFNALILNLSLSHKIFAEVIEYQLEKYIIKDYKISNLCMESFDIRHSNILKNLYPFRLRILSCPLCKEMLFLSSICCKYFLYSPSSALIGLHACFDIKPKNIGHHMHCIIVVRSELWISFYPNFSWHNNSWRKSWKTLPLWIIQV